MRPTTAGTRRPAPARALHRVEHGDRGGEREGEFLHRRRAGFLQVIAADVHRIPFRHPLEHVGEGDGVGDQRSDGFGREDVGAARQIFLDDVVLRRACSLARRRPVRVGHRDVERQQPGAVALIVIEVFICSSGMPSNSARMSPRWATGTPTLPTSPRARMWSVVAGLGRQVEGDGQAGLPLGRFLR
jgi:hypothetical protein